MGKCVSMCSNPDGQLDEGRRPDEWITAGSAGEQMQITEVAAGSQPSLIVNSPADASSAQRARAGSRTMGRRSTFKYVGEQTDHAARPEVEKTADDLQFIVEVLRQNQNLQRQVKLDEQHLKQLAKYAWREEVRVGEMLMCEGDLSNELFFVVTSGSLNIVADTPFEIVTTNGVSSLTRPEQAQGPQDRQGKTERNAGRGICIGDRSMVFNQPRLVTATATEHVVCWAFSQADFKIIQRQAMQVGGVNNPASKKTDKEQRLLEEVLSANANLQRLVPLNAELIRQVVSVACREDINEGHTLMYEGDLNAEAFYIVSEGELEAIGSEPFEVVKEGGVSYFHRAAHTGEKATAKQGPTVRNVGKGHCFGEISMLHCAPRFATMKALKKTTLWMIDRLNFEIVQMKGAEEYLKNRVKYLDGLASASNLPQGGRGALAGLLDTMRFTEGELMLKQGEVGTTLYILYDGSVSVEKDGVVETKLQAVPAKGTCHHFGEPSLSKDRPNPQTVRVTSPTATVLVLEREDFMSVWDQVIEGVRGPSFGRLYTQVIKNKKDDLSLENMTKLGLLCASTFGPVDLVKHETTGETYALKKMSKGLVARRGMIGSLAQEKEVWEMLTSPFIVKLVRCFPEDQTFNILLEAGMGGDLLCLYHREKFHGSLPHARYYVAGITLALDYLHRLKVAHRNVKPQNVVLSSAGQPKLTDMGLAKVVIGQTYTMCGTPQYMAPEVLAGTGHGRSVDWWSLGVVAVELMAGVSPFDAEHPMKVYSKIMLGIARVETPAACEGDLWDLAKLLVKPQAIERLPMRQGGIKNIQDHAWFASFDWNAMQMMGLKAPWVPKLDDNTDRRCFAPRESDVPQRVEIDNSDLLWEGEFAT